MRKIILSVCLLMVILVLSGVSYSQDTPVTDFMKSGIAKFEAKDYTGAVEDFTKVIAQDDKNGNAYYSRGVAYYYLLKNDEAMADF